MLSTNKEAEHLIPVWQPISWSKCIWGIFWSSGRRIFWTVVIQLIYRTTENIWFNRKKCLTGSCDAINQWNVLSCMSCTWFIWDGVFNSFCGKRGSGISLKLVCKSWIKCKFYFVYSFPLKVKGVLTNAHGFMLDISSFLSLFPNWTFFK